MTIHPLTTIPYQYLVQVTTGIFLNRYIKFLSYQKFYMIPIFKSETKLYLECLFLRK